MLRALNIFCVNDSRFYVQHLNINMPLYSSLHPSNNNKNHSFKGNHVISIKMEICPKSEKVLFHNVLLKKNHTHIDTQLKIPMLCQLRLSFPCISLHS